MIATTTQGPLFTEAALGVELHLSPNVVRVPVLGRARHVGFVGSKWLGEVLEVLAPVYMPASASPSPPGSAPSSIHVRRSASS